jgi:hypothetical protein
MTAFLAIAWRVLSWCVPIPLALIAAAYAWFQIDKHSAVRKAVDKAVTEMVAGAQIATLEAQLEASERAVAFERGRAEAFEDATQKFDQARQEAEQETERLDNELDALKAAPPPAACDVTDDLINRLR